MELHDVHHNATEPDHVKELCSRFHIKQLWIQQRQRIFLRTELDLQLWKTECELE